ncbi:hypothetical protein KDA_36040 [Dictyobacter alpinus]|uniref:Uncharacterized protein n=1 Tax=Dictyobacter alpinus TaxID=2014873 RepID=A0A402B9Z0_9CHLR|nr:hypothetical protein KDA_30270 [Dictyobacter alpinus]GCE28120.1 hypothetical protein KDA_36040 [Dictyobacter alpinus]
MHAPELKPCPECGGARVRVSYSMGVIMLAQFKRSASFLGKKSRTSSTQPVTCTSCGYTVVYATEPNNLIPDNS